MHVCMCEFVWFCESGHRQAPNGRIPQPSSWRHMLTRMLTRMAHAGRQRAMPMNASLLSCLKLLLSRP